MKKRLLILFCAISVFAVSFGISKNIIGNNLKDTGRSSTQSATQPQYLYYIGDYKGNLAVFKGHNSSPIKVFDIYTASLPEQDYLMVLNKIGAKNETELQNLIEEFTS